MGMDRDGPSDLASQSQIPLLENELRPLQESLHDTGARSRIGWGGQKQAVGGAELVQQRIEAIVLVHASAVAAYLAGEADVAVGELVLIKVDDLELHPFLLELILDLVQNVACVPERTRAPVERDDLHASAYGIR